jgi:hypothetical protein
MARARFACKWRLVKQRKWTYMNEHISLLEARALLMGFRALLAGRDQGKRFMHRHIVVLVDNTAVLGAVTKGRSSSRQLNRIYSKLAVLLAAADVKAHYLYVPSKENPADAPSRIFPFSFPISKNCGPGNSLSQSQESGRLS